MPAHKRTPREGIAMMTDELEGEENGVPFGLLKWGQAGIYNAVDDRVAIAALSDSQYGVVRGTEFTAGPGLTVNVAAGWMAVASCDDGTSAVVSSRQTHQVEVPAGSPTGETQYVVWVETNVDAARWEMRVLPRGTERTRSGVSLGIIVVPPGANLSSQFDFEHETVPHLGRHSDGELRRTTAAGWAQLTPIYGLWTDTPLRRSHSAYVLRAFGEGVMGAAPQNPQFRLVPQGQAAVLVVHPGSAAGGNLWLPARSAWSWQAEGIFHLDSTGSLIRTKLAVTVSLKLSHRAIHPSQTMSGVMADAGRGPTHVSMHMYLQGGFAGTSGGQSLTCYGSTFEPYQPWTD